MFAANAKVLFELVSDPVWSERLENAESMEEAEKVIADFCEEKGYRVARV